MPCAPGPVRNAFSMYKIMPKARLLCSTLKCLGIQKPAASGKLIINFRCLTLTGSTTNQSLVSTIHSWMTCSTQTFANLKQEQQLTKCTPLVFIIHHTNFIRSHSVRHGISQSVYQISCEYVEASYFPNTPVFTEENNR